MRTCRLILEIGAKSHFCNVHIVLVSGQKKNASGISHLHRELVFLGAGEGSAVIPHCGCFILLFWKAQRHRLAKEGDWDISVAKIVCFSSLSLSYL